jgi:hypothetical protein
VRPTFLFLLTFLSLSALYGCGGKSSGLTGGSQQQAAPDRRAAWAVLEQNPGVAGKDYDPQRIMLVYKRGAALPANWPSQPQVAASAAAAPNASLRQNQQYEALTDAVAARYGLTITQQVYLQDLNLASFKLPAGASGSVLLQQIRSDAGAMLTSAVFVPLKHASYTSNDPDFASGPSGQQWSHWRVNCDNAWDTTKGSASVMVAVIDTGVRLTHEELSAQVINPQTAFPSSTCDLANSDKSIEDTDGHGTFIAGMVAAQQDNNRTITGVAPLCRVLPIKISNDGLAGVDTLIAGALLAGQLGAKVVNYSWGGYDDIPAEEAMIDQLTGQGVLFVCAAGNDGVEADEYPSYFTNAFSVGATDDFDDATSFSNWGLSVDIAAPGEDLKSCAHTSDSAYDSAGLGTSFAAPMVAAGAGLLWSYRPELTRQQVRDALQFQGPSASGFLLPIRRLDLAAALNSVLIHLTPSVTGVVPAARTSIGTVPLSGFLDLSVLGAVNVVRVDYTLDLAPIGTDGPEDLMVSSILSGTFAAQLDIRTLKNQPAALRAEYTSSTNDTASMTVQPLWVFNQRGDLDGDGIVGSTDLLMLTIHRGEMVADSGFMGYMDSDRDGTITEADASAVGYFYGNGAVAPVISDVDPMNGLTGTSLPLSATVTGSGQLSYQWDFGGGAVPNLSAQPAPTVVLGAIGTYNASVTVTSEFGLQDQFAFTLDVQPRPGATASFTATPLIGIAPLTVEFDASASSSPGGSIVEYQWSWDGDTTWEETTTVPVTSHVFDTVGLATVRLRVRDDVLDTEETTVDITVSNRPGATARLSAAPFAGAPPLTVNFDAGASDSPGGSIVQYDWSWDGDAVWEDTTGIPTNSHIFPDLGDFTVRLRVTDDLATTSEITKLIRVTDGSPITNWGTTVLGPWGYSYSPSRRTAVTLVNGCPAVIWEWVDPASPSDAAVYVATARTPTPTSISDWRVDLVASGFVDRNDVGICDAEGEAAFVFRRKSPEGVVYGRYHGETANCYDALLSDNVDHLGFATVGGRPAVLVGRYGSGSVQYGFPTVSDPSSSSEWTFAPVSGVPGMRGQVDDNFKLLEISGRPYVMSYSVADDITVYYASNSTPASSDWSCCTFAADYANDPYYTIFNCGGVPGILYWRWNGVTMPFLFSLATTPMPSSESDWVTYNGPNAGQESTSALLDGRPAYAGYSSGTIIQWALTPEPLAESDWAEMDVSIGGRLIDHGGLPAFVGGDGANNVAYHYPIL